MKVIVTRPQADAAPLLARLTERGHMGRALPLLAIVARDDAVIPPMSWQAVCITSANGLTGLKPTPELLSLPLLCVGPQSAAAARNYGFTSVQAHGGNVEGLAAYVSETLSPRNGPLLYLSGAETSGDLEGRLKASGFTVERVICYDAVPQRPEGLAAAVNWADAVMLYSPRTARLWADSVAAIAGDASRLCHVCLSANVARQLPQSWPLRVADTPDEIGILASLERSHEGH